MKTLSMVREEGINVLNDKLGPVDAIRFLRQYDNGHGDYTQQRGKLLGSPSVEELFKACRKMRTLTKGRQR